MKIAEAEEEEMKRKDIQTAKQVGQFLNPRWYVAAINVHNRLRNSD